MTTLQIEAQKTEANTIDGMSYHFTKNRIEYSLFMQSDCITVWKKNNQRGGSISNDCFWNGINNQGRQMSKTLQEAVSLISA